LEKIREGEASFLIPSITSFFDFEVGERIECSNCSDTSITYESMSMLCTIIKSRIRESVSSFFNGYEWDCECGGKKKTTRFITKLPKYLIIQIGRYSYDNDAGKVKDKIGMESLKLDRLMSKAEPDSLLSRKFIEEGYPEEDVKSILRMFCNDEKKSKSSLEMNIINEQRNDPKYRVIGCINHSGTNVKTGHYTWWVYDEERCYLIDDTHVLNSDVEVLEDGYIYLFK